MTERVSAGRRLAVQALLRQEQDGYSNLVLDGVLRQSDAPAREKAFAGAVFYGVIERLYTLDWMLSRCLRQPLEKLDAPVRAVLRAGLYQAVYLDSVPAAAAVNESVQLVRALRKSSAAGLVNAVLRRACTLRPDPSRFADPVQRLSVCCSVSPAVAAAFYEWYGPDAQKVLDGFFEKPQLALRANTLQNTPQQLCEQLESEGWQASPGPLEGSVIAAGSGAIVHTRAFAEGRFHVQGLASQLACLNLAPRPGETVLDVCAAPGGKSATLAQLMGNEGRLFCGDGAKNRVKLIDETLRRLGIIIAQTRWQDASRPVEEWNGADRILCDVPCSGLGILAKKPDIRCKTLEGLGELCALQAAILDTCAGYLKPGGRLVYSTCTLNPDENRRQVERFLAAHPDFRPAEPAVVLPGSIQTGCMVELRPDLTGTDGFFVATMERL